MKSQGEDGYVVRFIRKHGRVIPIRVKTAQQHKPKVDYKALLAATAGVAGSIYGASWIGSKAASKFGKKAMLPAMLSAVFLSEAVVAEGVDRFTESLGMKKRPEQNIKNAAGGLVGVIGAYSALRKFKK